MDYLGIHREAVFAPGKEDADRAILDAVAQQLLDDGAQVAVTDREPDDWPAPHPQTVVFAMCQSAAALERLQSWEQQGVRVINSVDAVRNCHRHRTLEILRQAGVPIPPSIVVPTTMLGEAERFVEQGPVWLKRADVHATEPGDVRRIASPTSLRQGLASFAARGIAHAVLQVHVEGEVTKFYGVADRFFHEVDGGNDSLREVASKATASLGLEVWGGDCVRSSNGELTLIDLNDWPSYGPCRAPAAAAIAAHIRAQKDPA